MLEADLRKREVLNKTSLAMQICEVLRQRIVNLEIGPGERIDAKKLEKEFDVSQAPIRDALQRLSSEGLVRIEPRVGYFAVQFSPKDIKDIYNTRKLFEIYALQKAIDKIPLSELEALQEESLKLCEDELPKLVLRKRFDQTDRILHHDLILKNSDNKLLRDFANRINSLTEITRHLNRRIREALEEHLAIIDALIRKDVQEAEEALQLHLDNVEQDILDQLRKETPQYAERGREDSAVQIRG